ncbi:MAG TPA: protein kinase [Candidatus Fimenecus excrementigallinarum]|uniref:Protein kinase n=1 Tax=Candidatus Fimenecus excrementigallinarum TaxID=2840816 RepID=A0A9D1IFX1_9FIRM|nr:protein kinase [Candidatus Fimenecus excrementigallinarum]
MRLRELIAYQDGYAYVGKRFSILGDSISTLAGYNPKGYSVFYSGENCEKTGVRDITDTWWGKVVDCFGGELLVNNSWSGSRVTQLPGSDSLFPSGCSDARTGGLHIRNVMPDVILVYLGINDWANGVPIENKAGVIARRQDNRTFRCAYATMLRKLKANYPNAEIWCCTLCATFMSSKPSFNFPYVYNGSNITAYNQVIEAVAKQYACRVIDLFNSGCYDSIDGTHPNAEGMDMLASSIINETRGEEIRVYYETDECAVSSDTKHDTDEDEHAMSSDTKYDADADYVFLPTDITKLLFDTNQLKLHDAAANQGIELQGDYLAVGRRSDCALQIDNTCISQIHAAFYYEGTGWFVMDKNSLNGTWLNGKKLKQNTKYELFPGDTLNFAKAKEYVFYDDKPREHSEAEARGISEKENEYNVGSVLNNRYKLVKEVGGGGLSTVYLALDTTADKFWAVKLVKTEAAGNARQIRDSVMREAKMMQSFAHPAIPKVADILDTAEYAAIVMEYIEGETLENVVKTHGAQPVESVTAWALQLCDVLGYLHAQNPPVIYRDMKPANIILKPDGNISILDFGIMRTYKPNQKADTACLGTAGFAAPEQYGTSQTDCRSDIYALGMTMYNLCSGIRPTGKSGVSFGTEKDRLNKFFISIIKKCTALNPADRYPSCAALAKDLRIVWETGRAKEKWRRFKT